MLRPQPQMTDYLGRYPTMTIAYVSFVVGFFGCFGAIVCAALIRWAI